MPMDACVAIDSNSLSYLVDAMNSGQQPTGDLCDQKISLLRVYLYRNEILYLVPTVESEYKRIKDEIRREIHDGISMVLLGDVLEADPTLLENRVCQYSIIHSGKKNNKDCQILAEAELGGCEYLLTYDFKFLARLKDKTQKITMITPSEFWELLNIPHGSNPVRVPHHTNPLSKQTWWIW